MADAELRLILRPVELTPSEAALAYIMVSDVATPPGRVRDAASILAKCEAAMVGQAEPPPPMPLPLLTPLPLPTDDTHEE